MFDPPLPVCATLKSPNGGVWGLGPDGGVFAFEGAPFYGSAAGQPYFVGRHGARLLASDSPELPAAWNPGRRPAGGYVIQSTSNELYGPYVS